jgi:RNA polymerase sigma factor (sigma-70 family)
MMRQSGSKIADFFEEQRGRLLHYIRSRSGRGDPEEAEDLLQDIFASLLGQDLEDIEDIGSYVYHSAHNRIVDSYRRKRPDHSLQDVKDKESGSTFEELLADLRFEAHSKLERKEILKRIESAMDKLPEDQRAVWTATEIEGKPFNELVAEWDEPLNTLLSRKHRAVKALRMALKDLAPGFSTGP